MRACACTNTDEGVFLDSILPLQTMRELSDVVYVQVLGPLLFGIFGVVY